MPNQQVAFMTQAQCAEHRGVSRQYISNLAKRGVLVMCGRLVDVQASDAVLDDKPEPQAAAGQQPTSFAQARVARRQSSPEAPPSVPRSREYRNDAHEARGAANVEPPVTQQSA